jgi:hypothetical protein
MNSVTNAVIGNASSADAGTVQGSASVSVLRKALNAEAAGVAQLLASLHQPPLATSGSVGTQLNAFA